MLFKEQPNLRNGLTVKLLSGIFPSKLVRKGCIMRIIKSALTSALIVVFISVAFYGTGGGAAFAVEPGGSGSNGELDSTFGPLFYIGLGAVAVIATFAIWQNVKDSEKEKAVKAVKEAEESEVENFEEYFENLEKIEDE